MKYIDSLTTNCLITRKIIVEDVTALAPFFADTETAKFIPGFGETDHNKQATAWINKQLGRYGNNSGGLQALISKASGELIGQCGLLVQQVDGLQELEIGYHIMPQFRRLGYATEAAMGFKQYVFKNDIAQSVISIIHRENVASQKVALNNGMRKEKETTFHGFPVYVYRVTAEEYNRCNP